MPLTNFIRRFHRFPQIKKQSARISVYLRIKNRSICQAPTPQSTCDDTVTIADYQATIKGVNDLNTQIEDLRHQLDGLLDDRDDASIKLSGYNTRALSAVRGIFGPDSTEYDQAGGTRTSERKAPVRAAKPALAKAA